MLNMTTNPTVAALHSKIISIDSHCDTPMWFKFGIDIGKENPVLTLNPKEIGEKGDKMIRYRVKVDVPKMKKGLLDAIVMVAYIPQGQLTEKASENASKKTFTILNQLLSQIEKNSKIVGQAKTSADIVRLKNEGRKAIILGLENGYGIGKDIENVKKLADMGVVYITLSHNGDNDICDSHKGKTKHNGLSKFGEEVVREMNRLGIIVDISHTSEKTSFDALKISSKPVIASHSSVKAICNHSRNISDELMKAIAAKGGVIQICLYNSFLKVKGKASIKDAVDHIDYVVRTVGIDHVGIGSDFDGGGELSDLKNASDYPKITEELLLRGYSETDIAKIWGGNFMRVMDEVKP
jgi:microsomal dipeptidase-like Zn-dependent dipeptidase